LKFKFNLKLLLVTAFKLLVLDVGSTATFKLPAAGRRASHPDLPGRLSHGRQLPLAELLLQVATGTGIEKGNALETRLNIYQVLEYKYQKNCYSSATRERNLGPASGGPHLALEEASGNYCHWQYRPAASGTGRTAST